jgi:hypothetical protein
MRTVDRLATVNKYNCSHYNCFERGGRFCNLRKVLIRNTVHPSRYPSGSNRPTRCHSDRRNHGPPTQSLEVSSTFWSRPGRLSVTSGMLCTLMLPMFQTVIPASA